jgi:hypothetical protein
MLLLAAFCAVGDAAADYQLPDTGITKCYNNAGTEIACPGSGQPFYGQDAQYEGPQPSFRDNGNGTVTDVNTGIVWQNPGDSIQRTWQESINYCAALELGGFSDWRLPNKPELFSIVDLGRANPSVNPIFPLGSNAYWASSTCSGYPIYAWRVNFEDGNLDCRNKSYGFYTLCVRGGS